VIKKTTGNCAKLIMLKINEADTSALKRLLPNRTQERRIRARKGIEVSMNEGTLTFP